MIAKGLISVMSEKLLTVGSLELCFEFKKNVSTWKYFLQLVLTMPNHLLGVQGMS